MPRSPVPRSSLLLAALLMGACGPSDGTSSDGKSAAVVLPTGADPNAVQLMRSVESTYRALNTLMIEAHSVSEQVYMKMHAFNGNARNTTWLARPYKYRWESQFTGAMGNVGEKLTPTKGSQTSMSDGTKLQMLGVMGDGCLEADAPDVNAPRASTSEDPQFNTFFGFSDMMVGVLNPGYWATDMSLASPGFRTLTIKGQDTFEGNPYTVVEWTYYVDYSMPDDDNLFTTQMYIGEDKLIHRIITKNPVYSRDVKYTVYANEPIPDELFSKVPPGTKCKRPPPMKMDEKYAYLPIGAQGPDFSLTDAATGKVFTLKEMLAGKKAMIINFMSYG